MTKRIIIPKMPAKNETTIVYDGIKQYAVFNVEGEVFVVNHRCPHGGSPLSKGKVITNSPGGPRIKCARHGWEFNLRDGVSHEHPVYCLATFSVEYNGDAAYIIVPETL